MYTCAIKTMTNEKRNRKSTNVEYTDLPQAGIEMVERKKNVSFTKRSDCHWIWTTPESHLLIFKIYRLANSAWSYWITTQILESNETLEIFPHTRYTCRERKEERKKKTITHVKKIIINKILIQLYTLTHWFHVQFAMLKYTWANERMLVHIMGFCPSDIMRFGISPVI